MTRYVLTPPEPTDAMLDASLAYDINTTTRGHNRFVYLAMLAARPPIDYDALAKELMGRWLTVGSMAQALREVLP